MRILLHNHHTPYTFTLATALPDVTFHVLPTPAHAAGGWRQDQRPILPNVERASPFQPWPPVDVVLVQTLRDLDACGRADSHGPLLALAHNHAELDSLPARWLHELRLPLVCISPMKGCTWAAAGYDLPVTVIEPAVAVESMPQWEGTEPVILTVCNRITRPLFDTDSWLAVTEGLPVRLVGEGNDGIPGAVGPAASWDALKDEYRRARVYLNPCAPPYEDADNLASIEARACGMPVFSLHGWHRQPSADAIRSAQERLQGALDGTRPLAPSVRPKVAERWSLARFAQQWRQVLEEVMGRG